LPRVWIALFRSSRHHPIQGTLGNLRELFLAAGAGIEQQKAGRSIHHAVARRIRLQAYFRPNDTSVRVLPNASSAMKKWLSERGVSPSTRPAQPETLYRLCNQD
jgi:hypothetical protein